MAVTRRFMGMRNLWARHPIGPSGPGRNRGTSGGRGKAGKSRGGTYQRRQPEATALYHVFQEHLGTFEQQWVDEAEGCTLPRFVTEELRGFLSCGVLARGFAPLLYETCSQRHLVALCCKGRVFCPSCLGRRMNEGAANLVEKALPEVPIRQRVLTMPNALRFPLAFDGRLLAAVLRIFIDTVSAWYREWQNGGVWAVAGVGQWQ